MIIWIASYPRSGNNYFQLLLRRLYNFAPHTIYAPVQKENNSQKFHHIYGEIPPLKDWRILRDCTDVHCVKTHELPSRDKFPAIYLVRDGRDVIVSYAHFIQNIEKSTDSLDTLLHRLIVSSNFFGGWSKNVRKWMQRKTPTAIIKFEELICAENPFHIVEQSLNFIGHYADNKNSNARNPDFSELNTALPNIFRKGKIGSWRTEMSPKLQKLFWKHHGKTMTLAGYEP